MLFEPARDAAHQVLAPDFSFPVLGLSPGGAWGSDVVGWLLEENFGHGGGDLWRCENVIMVLYLFGDECGFAWMGSCC